MGEFSVFDRLPSIKMGNGKLVHYVDIRPELVDELRSFKGVNNFLPIFVELPFLASVFLNDPCSRCIEMKHAFEFARSFGSQIPTIAKCIPDLYKIGDEKNPGIRTSVKIQFYRNGIKTKRVMGGPCGLFQMASKLPQMSLGPGRQTTV